MGGFLSANADLAPQQLAVGVDRRGADHETAGGEGADDAGRCP